MNAHMNFNFVNNATDWQAMLGANSEAVEFSNQAVAASRAGRYAEAAGLHRKALALKLEAYPKDSVQAAISYNGLGECLIKVGDLVEAEKALQQALRVRDTLAMGPREDAAATRDNMGQLYEAKGDFEEARKIRVKGGDKNEIMCSNYHCHAGLFALKDLKACGGCKAALYHDVACQKRDWKMRHKVLCTAYQAKVKAAQGSA